MNHLQIAYKKKIILNNLLIYCKQLDNQIKYNKQWFQKLDR